MIQKHRSSSLLSVVSKLLKAKQYKAYLEADALLGRAREDARVLLDDAQRKASEEAGKILAGARERAEKIRERAREDEMLTLRRMIAQAENELERSLNELEPKIAKLSARIAEKIIGEQLKLDPDAILSIVREALRNTRRQRCLEIRINPAYETPLRRRLAELKEFAHGVLVVGDNKVSPGGCLVRCDWGEIDARLETQIDSFEQRLFEVDR